MTKQTIKILMVGAIVLFLISNLYLAITNTLKFSAGTHNVDLAYNMCNLETMFNTTLIDLNSQGVNWTKDEMYSYGLKQINTGFRRVLLHTMLIGLIFGLSFSSRRKK